MQHSYPVGKAQKQVLDALGRSDIETFQGAEAFFARIGIAVTPVRVGRQSVPSITRLDSVRGAFNAYGEGETWDMGFESVDLSKIQQWMSR